MSHNEFAVSLICGSNSSICSPRIELITASRVKPSARFPRRQKVTQPSGYAYVRSRGGSPLMLWFDSDRPSNSNATAGAIVGSETRRPPSRSRTLQTSSCVRGCGLGRARKAVWIPAVAGLNCSRRHESLLIGYFTVMRSVVLKLFHLAFQCHGQTRVCLLLHHSGTYL